MYPQQPKKKLSLFGKPKPKQESQETIGLTEQINSLSGRLRMLEERINNLNRKVEVDESNMLENQKRVNVEFKTLSSEIVEVKRAIEEIKETIEMITREMPNLAAKDELDVLKKYIEMWEPMNFVTRDELDKLLKEKQRNP